MKILAFVCDPIKRLYSHLKMKFANQHGLFKHGAQIEDVWRKAEALAREWTECLDGFHYSEYFGKGENLLSFACWKTMAKKYDRLIVGKLNLGMFYSKLSPWVKIFGLQKIHLVDGTNLGIIITVRNL